MQIPVAQIERNTTPWQCTRCGTHFAAGAVGGGYAQVAKCGVCGSPLDRRQPSTDPQYDAKNAGQEFLAFTTGFWPPMIKAIAIACAILGTMVLLSGLT